MDIAGVLPSFTGVAVHDGWVSYLHYGCRHALCNAHHLRELTARYHALLKDGFIANPPNLTDTGGKRDRNKQSKTYNLLRRLEQGSEETLRFMDDFSAPCDNNLAERDIRMMKVQRKVSGGFRSTEGADAFCRIRSYISTLRKQGHSVLTALQLLITGKPLFPTTEPE